MFRSVIANATCCISGSPTSLITLPEWSICRKKIFPPDFQSGFSSWIRNAESRGFLGIHSDCCRSRVYITAESDRFRVSPTACKLVSNSRTMLCSTRTTFRFVAAMAGRDAGVEISENVEEKVENPSPAFQRRSISRQKDSFQSDKSVTWRSLGLSVEVSDALSRANLVQPSLVQAATIPLICSGGDVIVAAETGSGKTHAYMAPIFEMTLRKRKEVEKMKDELIRVPRSFSLVLCPNATLCQQVVDMAGMLRSVGGADLLDVTAICGGQGWPLNPPDVVVATPAALLNHLFSYDPRGQRRKAFVRDTSCVVFDEADMLLGGGFAREVDNLINLLRLDEKKLAKLSSLQLKSRTQESVQPWTEFKVEEDDSEGKYAAEDQIEDDIEPDGYDDDGLSATEQGSDLEVPHVDNSKYENRKNYWMTRKQYPKSKQYVFIAATLPNSGKKSPGELLRRLFPEAKRVNGNLLHFHNPRLKHVWVKVSQDTMIQALLKAISEGHEDADQETPITRTLVFANSIDAVEAISRVLRKAEINVLSYHKDISAEERREILRAFQQEGGVMVCTDAAARGIDIHNIGNVIQAEFSTSAVDFLHRVGRTGRAGQSGMVTNLFMESNRALVEAVRKALVEGLPVDSAFSRKRSFRNKLKKYAGRNL